MEDLVNHSFETNRLRVFRFAGIQPMPQNCVHTLWVAFRLDEDRPMVCATAMTFQTNAPQDSPAYYLDWIEVSTEHRRKGFGTELFAALNKRLHNLYADPATDDGEKFLSAYEKANHA
jgi:hypothetical protein